MLDTALLEHIKAVARRLPALPTDVLDRLRVTFAATNEAQQ